MITNIPLAQDFETYGIDYLNLSWGESIDLLRTLEEAGTDSTDTESYWNAAQRHLGTALSLCHQGTEFLMKGHIAAISPFLLLSKPPSAWPSKCDSVDTPYANFHAVDSNELLRLYNTVCPQRLSKEFMDSFEEIRKLRNSITHTISGQAITAKQIIKAILLASEAFTGSRKWLAHRRRFLDREHTTILVSSDYNEATIAADMLITVEALDRGDLLRHFGFDRKRRRYQCSTCYFSNDMAELDNSFAVLEPNTPSSTNLHCFVCNQNEPVVRKDCLNDECKGNVIRVDDNTCVLCGTQQD